jgi:hypothetical protein
VGSVNSAANSASVQKADRSRPSAWSWRSISTSHSRSNSPTLLSAIARARARGSVARSRSSRWTATKWCPSVLTTRSGILSRLASSAVLLPAMTQPRRSIRMARPAPYSRSERASASRPRSVPRLAFLGSDWRSMSRIGWRTERVDIGRTCASLERSLR